MILGFELTLFLYGLLAAIFCLVRRHSAAAALRFIVPINLALLCVINPLLLLYLILQLSWVALIYAFITVAPQCRSVQWSWLAFIGLLPLNMAKWAGDPEKIPELLLWYDVNLVSVGWYLGATFFVIRSFVVLREALFQPEKVLLPALATLTFLPSFAAGPVCGSQPWSQAKLKTVGPRVVIHSLMRFGWGAAALYILSPRIHLLAEYAATLPMGKIADIYLSFAALYLDFSGYTAMALAIAALYGVTLPENFNRPYLATSVREFWRRWHMSLSAFVADYLMKPMVRRSGSRWLGVTVAFLFTGLWHELSWRYLAWGVAHGLALSASLREWPFLEAVSSRCPGWLRAAIGWATTMTFVAIASYMVQGRSR
jgi:D-alanyl-lipoteichoic acid acyltransferase DltB (MBOAT superfamily)